MWRLCSNACRQPSKQRRAHVHNACHANICIRHYEGMHDRTPANIENHIPAIAMGHHICTRALQPQPQPAPGARSSQPQPWRPAPESASHSQAPGARRPEIPRHQPTYVQSKVRTPPRRRCLGKNKKYQWVSSLFQIWPGTPKEFLKDLQYPGLPDADLAWHPAPRLPYPGQISPLCYS